jgi:hypothetical protein
MATEISDGWARGSFVEKEETECVVLPAKLAFFLVLVINNGAMVLDSSAVQFKRRAILLGGIPDPYRKKSLNSIKSYSRLGLGNRFIVAWQLNMQA